LLKRTSIIIFKTQNIPNHVQTTNAYFDIQPPPDSRSSTVIDTPVPACLLGIASPAQVQAFFERAVLISARQQHDFFLSARGTLESRYDQWQWVIRNMGTATLTASNGDTFLLGDPNQESDLSGE
jgi:hypothetical protein